MHSPFDQLFRDAIKMKLLRLLQQNLPRLQKADQLITHPNRHGAIGKSGKTGDRARTIARFLSELALYFQTRGANAIRAGH